MSPRFFLTETKRNMSKLRPSPNEEARMIREEHERRRKLRIQQVREQHRTFAQQIRREVEQRRRRELEKLGEELRTDWERQQREKLDTLQKLYQESLQLLGQGHRSAKENEPDLAALARKEEENHAKAAERHREALKELKSQRLKDHERQNRCINTRKKALQAEKERAAKVASLPPPPPNPIQNIDAKKSYVVKKSDVSAFAATHYHMPESAVDREEETMMQPNAHEEAELEVRRLQDLQREEQRRRVEQLERARLRGKQALRKEHLVQDRERLLVELEHMQQTDLLRRRQQVAHMPPQIFQPLYKRQETREDFQREMEFAFEDMYTGERRVKGDLVVQLVPEPLPALSTDSQDQALDVTLEEISAPGEDDTQQDAASSESGTSAQDVPSRPAPRRALKKLLDRIRGQRNHWADRNSCTSEADSPAANADHIPERDTTIDTGSLTNEEKEDLPPAELPDSSPSAMETAEPAAVADTRHPDGLLDRIREFEEARNKREEELERERRQQVALLQELEEQKAKLEQMLLEAQQEREHLKAAVTEQGAAKPAEVLIQDQRETSVPPGQPHELVPPSREDDHSSRIREYQQRLLEQNRTHQRSVQVARQRLEEYQRAVRIRHNMTAAAASSSSAVVHRPPRSAPLRPSAPALSAYIHAQSQTSVGAPTEESDGLSSPPLLTGSRLLSDDGESLSGHSNNQRQEVTAWLTDDIMEKVTRHLRERDGPSSLNTEPLPHRAIATPASPTSVALQPTSDGIITTSRRNAEDVTAHRLGPEGVKRAPAPHAEPVSSRADDVERQRRELQEAQRRFLEQRESTALQERRRGEEEEEERSRREVAREQVRREKETLQALIQHDAEPPSEPSADVSASDGISQTRLKILASLLRAIEETNGGSLSHLEEDPEEREHRRSNDEETDSVSLSDVPAGPTSASDVLAPPRAAKPPVTRVRLGLMEMMTAQHELSVIPEVETPVNSSLLTGPEENLRVPLGSAGWDPQDGSDSSLTSDSSLQTPSLASRGQQTIRSQSGSGASSRRSSYQAWRDRLMGSSPESSESESARRRISPVSSDSGRGADYSGRVFTSFRSPTQSAHRPRDSDCLSSTTISTGSYITSDPEQNFNTDKSRPLKHFAEGGESDLLDVSAAAAAHPGAAVDSLFNDSSIQHIIDRYTKELNVSLNSTGKTSDGGGSFADEAAPSVSQQSLVRVTGSSREDEGSSARRSPRSDAATDQRRGPGSSAQSLINPIGDQSSGRDPSHAEEQDSFRPLIGRLIDQSSCLAADDRTSTMEQLVGQPSAHSSMIGQPVSVSVDQSGWDSTLTRMIGRLSHQSSSHWLSGGQDFYAGRLIGEMPSERSTTWLDEGGEETLMRPLVGELDESVGSSGERTRVDLGVSTEAMAPSYPALPSEASTHSAPQEQTHQDRTGSTTQHQERSEVFPDSDSFHPLLAEVTHNETSDPCMSFHPPGHDGQPTREDGSMSTPSDDDPSVESDASPERLRAEEPPGRTTASPAAHDSFSQLMTSQLCPRESVLTLSPSRRTDEDVTTLNLSHLNMCDDSAAVRLPQPEEADANGTLKESEAAVQVVRNAASLSNIIMEAACEEKGILEQSEITLVSLTDTTLQDQETTVTDGEDVWEERDSDVGNEEGQKAEVLESALLLDGPQEDKNRKHPGMLLEFRWDVGGSLQDVSQHKRRALIQRSSRRVEEIKAKAVLAKTQPQTREPPEAKEPCTAKESHPAARKAKTKPESQRKAETSGVNDQKKAQRPLQVRSSRLGEAELTLCTPEQRKREVSEMHQRTQRLYEQLDEVKHQKAIRSRREAYAENRLKAKEFHKKTLQKLRAKRTLQ